MPTEFRVPDKAKPADQFARRFIDHVIKGKTDSSFVEVAPDVLNDEARQYIVNAGRNINGQQVKRYRVVGIRWTSQLMPGNAPVSYNLGYEYEFERGNILFTTTVREINGQFSIVSFNGQFLTAPLAELTRFTFHGKSVWQYIFLLFLILVPLFILASFIAMLRVRMTVKKKILWALITLLVALPRLLMNWNTGQIDFNLLSISLLGAGFSRPTLYSAWILSVNIPLGAILFWVKRRDLAGEYLLSEYDFTGDDQTGEMIEVPGA